MDMGIALRSKVRCDAARNGIDIVDKPADLYCGNFPKRLPAAGRVRSAKGRYNKMKPPICREARAKNG